MFPFSAKTMIPSARKGTIMSPSKGWKRQVTWPEKLVTYTFQKALTIDRRGGENSDSNNLFFEVMKVTLDVFYILAVFAAK